MGGFYLKVGDLKSAKESYENSLKVREKLAKLDPDNAEWQRDLSVSYNKMGDFYLKVGDLESAKESYENSLKVREKLVKLDPNNAGWQRHISVSYYKLYTIKNEKEYLIKCVHKMREMKSRGQLHGEDLNYLEQFEEILGHEK
jgi:tetratricopeptide (TPR) repeat protein